MVTSTIPGEGKSMVAAHLANAYAKAGKRVIVVGCDLRNPSLHSFLDLTVRRDCPLIWRDCVMLRNS